MMRIDILTLFPEMCDFCLSQSVIGRARKSDLFGVFCHNIRDYTKDKHKRVDDAPYGGGMGMIMSAQPIYDCYKAICNEGDGENKPHCIYLSPKGRTFNQTKAVELAGYDWIVLLCGHYEGVDERVLEEIVDEEISIGDYVLTGGELPAVVITDAVCRLLPGVLSDSACYEEESHYSGLLEYPQYTRPAEWMGKKVPDVLVSGHHANIVDWKRKQALKQTLLKRSELLESLDLDKTDLTVLEKLKKELNV